GAGTRLLGEPFAPSLPQGFVVRGCLPVHCRTWRANGSDRPDHCHGNDRPGEWLALSMQPVDRKEKSGQAAVRRQGRRCASRRTALEERPKRVRGLEGALTPSRQGEGMPQELRLPKRPVAPPP